MNPRMQKKIARAAEALKKYGAREVYVFGSLAEGTFGRHSDIDMAVAGLPPQVFFAAMGEAMTVLGRPLDLIDLDYDTTFVNRLREKGKLFRII